MSTRREWLTAVRKRQGFTTSELAQSANISQSYYSKIELGKKKPSVEVAKKIASVLLFDWTVFFRDVA